MKCHVIRPFFAISRSQVYASGVLILRIGALRFTRRDLVEVFLFIKLPIQASKMLGFFQRILDWFRSLFWKEEMELTLVGLQNSGKTTFVNVIAVRNLLC